MLFRPISDIMPTSGTIEQLKPPLCDQVKNTDDDLKGEQKVDNTILHKDLKLI